MIRLGIPTVFNGDLFAAQLRQTGLTPAVMVVEQEVWVGGVADSDRPTVEQTLANHSATAQTEATRLAGEQSNETSLRDRATTALADNKAFLAITSPTNAQVVAQVKALTRQNNALIRLALRRFDGTD